MRKMFLVCVLSLATALAVVGESQAQRWGRGWGGRGWGGRGWGGYGGYGYGGYGGYGGYYGSSYYSPYYYGGYSGYYRPYYYGGYSPYYYSGYGYSPYSYGSSYYPINYTPDSSNYYVNQSSNPTVTQSSSSATVHVLVPDPNAQVWFDNNSTRQTGTERWFHTPALGTGQNYSYTVKARWTENGRPVERERRVSVQPGQQLNVDFRNEL